MGILKSQLVNTGFADAPTNLIWLKTDNTVAEVTTAGYLSLNLSTLLNQLSVYQMAVVYTSDSGTVLLQVSFANGLWSLVSADSGDIALPTVANQVAYATNTAGALGAAGLATALFNAGNITAGTVTGTAGILYSCPGTTTTGRLGLSALASAGAFDVLIRNASHGQSSTYSIPDCGTTTANLLISKLTGTQHITVGAFQVDAGVISSGLATGPTAGGFIAYPATTTTGSLRLTPVGNVGNFNAIISDISTLGQSTTYTIPDPGAATAQFLLNTGTANILAEQEFVGISEVLTFGTGTWTTTRVAQGDYVSRHTPGDETSIVAIDVTPAIRVAASKGFRLDSFDVIYAIAANALDAQSVTLNRIVYADNVAVSSTAVAITGTLATATQANPYVTNVAVDAPAFLITADSKYVIELTVNNAAASEYDYYGIMLRFSQTIG